MATFLWPSNAMKAQSAKPRQFFTYKLPDIPQNVPLVQRSGQILSDDYSFDSDMSDYLILRKSLPSAPVMRDGQGPGGMMKHIVQTTNQYGANYLFIRDSGTAGARAAALACLEQQRPVVVKVKATKPRMTTSRMSAQERYLRQSRRTELNSRARTGFKYWFDDGVRKAPLAGPPIGTDGAPTGLPASVFAPTSKLLNRATTAK